MDKAKSAASASTRRARAERRPPRTLAVDIGGTGIKAELLDERGRPTTDRARIPTPKNATPGKVIGVIRKLAAMRGGFDRVSVGFPGLVKNGVIYTAPNLGSGWNNFDLEGELRRLLRRPVRVANDADVQGLGAVSGHGIELVITLGTGFGSVVFVDGHRIHLELGHHPFRKGKTYEDELGHRALKKRGKARWNRRLREAIDDLKGAFGYDRLFIGGGNTRYMRFEAPGGVKIVSNEDGLLGGIRLWADAAHVTAAAPTPAASATAKPTPAANVIITTEVRAVAKPPAPRRSAAALAAEGKAAARRKAVIVKTLSRTTAASPATLRAVESKSAAAGAASHTGDPVAAANPVTDSAVVTMDDAEVQTAAAAPRADNEKMPI